MAQITCKIIYSSRRVNLAYQLLKVELQVQDENGNNPISLRDALKLFKQGATLQKENVVSEPLIEAKKQIRNGKQFGLRLDANKKAEAFDNWLEKLNSYCTVYGYSWTKRGIKL